MTPTPSGRRPWQPAIDLKPPTDQEIAALVSAVHTVAASYGFTRSPGWNARPVPGSGEDTSGEPWTTDGHFLHIVAVWTRAPEDPYSLESDGLSVWGSGLIRGNVAGEKFELLLRPATPSVAAEMIAAFLDDFRRR